MKKKLVNMVILILFFVVLLKSIEIFKYFYAVNKNEKDFKYLASTINIDFEKYENKFEDKQLENVNNLLKENNNMYGWLDVKDTTVNYPVMNSESYLYKDFNGNYSISGTPFIDKNNNSILQIIHSHNMKNGTMFSPLLNFMKKDFFDTHKSIDFYTKNSKNTYLVYAVIKLNINDEQDLQFYQKSDLSYKEQFNKYLNIINDNAIIKSEYLPKINDEFIALSTCDNYNDDNRVVVVGVKSN